MGKLYDNLKKHFENTPQEELDKEWEEIKSLNEIGPDAIEYANWIKEYKNKLEIEYFERFKEERQEDKEKLIAEACRWFELHWREYILRDADNEIGFVGWKSDFRKAMEDLK